MSLTVSTQAELINALKSSTGGETILLNPGDYGDLSLIHKTTFNLEFGSTVTIGAADIDNPPVITGLDLRGAANLSFENILFDYTYEDGTPIWTKPFMVSGSDAISFSGCTFDGDLASGLSEADNGYPTGFGLNVSGTTGITVDDCEIRGFFRGMVVNNSDDVEITNNDVHSIRMDGMNFAAVQGVLIEGNNIHDFDRSMGSADHADMIQFWTNGTTRPSTDIVIRNNVLDIGDGQYTQSIFMRNDQVDRGLAGEDMFYQNVLIEGNTIVNGHLHGMYIGETAGLTITQNTVLHSDGGSPDGADASVEIPRIAVARASTDVTITYNATSTILGEAGQSDWTVSMNAFVQDQDPNAPGWYGDVFIASTLGSPEGAGAIRALDTGMLGRLGAGAPSLLATSKTLAIDAAFHTTTETAGGNEVHFDASYSTGSQPAGTSYQWDFGDGSKATGLQTTHIYADGGIYEAKLTIILPDGQQDVEYCKVAVLGNELVHLSDDGFFVASQNGIDTVIDSIRDHDADGGIQLGGEGVIASINSTHLTPIFGTDDVTISLQLDADAPGKTGEVVRLHGSFIMAVASTGEMSVRAWSSEGEAVTLTSKGQVVNDGNSYDVDLHLEDGRLSLWINDAMVTDTAFNGTFAKLDGQNLTFGNPWHNGGFQGDVTEFSVAINEGQTILLPDEDLGGLVAITADTGTTTVDVAEPVIAEPVIADTVTDTDMPAISDSEVVSVTDEVVTIDDTDIGTSTEISGSTAPSEEVAAVPPPSSKLVTLSDDGHFIVSQDGVEIVLNSIRDHDADGGIQLGSKGIAASVDRGFLAPMFETDDVTISLQLDADAAGKTGEIMRVNGSFIAAVDYKGEMSVRAWSSEGDYVNLTSTGLKINDGSSYAVDVRLEGGHLSLWVNDTMVKDAAFSGTFADIGRHDLTFGKSGNTDLFYGDVTEFSLAIDDGITHVDAFSAYAIDHGAPLA